MVTLLELITTFTTSLLLILLIIFLKMLGKEGRFFLMSNLMPGHSIFWGKDKAGHTHFHRVKSDGKSLRSGRELFIFLPDLLRLDKHTQIQAAYDALSEDQKKKYEKPPSWETITQMNEVNRAQAYLAKKPLYTGDLSMSIAANPHLQEALRDAEEIAKNEGDNETIFSTLQKLVKDPPEEKEPMFQRILRRMPKAVKTIHIVKPFDLDEITKYVSTGFTPRDSRESFQEGYVTGLKTVKSDQQMVIILVILFVIAILGVVFIMGR